MVGFIILLMSCLSITTFFSVYYYLAYKDEGLRTNMILYLLRQEQDTVAKLRREQRDLFLRIKFYRHRVYELTGEWEQL